MRVRVTTGSRPCAGSTGILSLACLGLLAALGCGGGGASTTPPIDPPVDPPPGTLDEQLRAALAMNSMFAPAPPPAQDPAQVELGRMLFFDKILSTRGDISCSGCHHPTLQMADAIPLSKGTNGAGLGPERVIFEGQTMVARNATDVFNRGLPSWRTMLWDARVEQLPNGQLKTPAGAETPDGLSGVLAAQALFALADDREMHAPGNFTPMTGNGGPGQGGSFMPPMPPPITDEDSLTDIWRNITNRVVFTPGYQPLIQAAYPGKQLHEITITQIANALAAFQTEKLSALDTPFDRYLRGDDSALTQQQKEGAKLFYGQAKCSSCHAGELMTDQNIHNILVPELGPGKDTSPGTDRGRLDVTGAPGDTYGFRTPPLRNVAETGPYMHNGAIATLEEVVRHHLDPVAGFRNLDTSHLPDDLRGTVKKSTDALNRQKATLDPVLATPIDLTDEQVDALVSFLHSLTDVSIGERLKDLEPLEVPSNISVDYNPGDGGPMEPGPDPVPMPFGGPANGGEKG